MHTIHITHAHSPPFTLPFFASHKSLLLILKIAKNFRNEPCTLPRSISRLRNDIATQRMTMTQKLLYENCVLHIYSFWRGWSRCHWKENVCSCCCCCHALCQWWVKAHRWKSMQTIAHKDSNSNSNFNLILLTLPYTRTLYSIFVVISLLFVCARLCRVVT